MLNLNSDMLRRMEDIRNSETGLLQIGMSSKIRLFIFRFYRVHRRFPGTRSSGGDQAGVGHRAGTASAAGAAGCSDTSGS